MTSFSTKTDAIDQYITPALGEYASDYDLDAIFDECFTWKDGRLVCIHEDDFYEIAAKYDTSK